MSWDSYIDNLMEGGLATDAAIVGFEPGSEGVWAAFPNGSLKSISQDEIRCLVGSDRHCFFQTGSNIAGKRCTVLRDSLFDETNPSMDLRTKASEQEKETCNIVVAKSKKALIIVQAPANTHGGKVNDKAFKVIEHLKKCDM